MLMNESQFHEETLRRIGLMKTCKEYKEYALGGEAARNNTDSINGLEFFSLLKSTRMDVVAEYKNYEQLKRMR